MRFHPAPSSFNGGTMGGPIYPYLGYLTHEDWRDIAARPSQQPLRVSDVAQLVGRAHRLAEDGEPRLALVEAITALEVAVSSMLQWHFGGRQAVQQALESFERTTFAARVAAAAGFSGRISAEDVEHLIEAITARHRIVHEGALAPDDVRELLYTVLDAATLLDSGEQFKYPSIVSSNHAMTVVQWEESYARLSRWSARMTRAPA